MYWRLACSLLLGAGIGVALCASAGRAQTPSWGVLELKGEARWIVDSLPPLWGSVRLRLPEGLYRVRALAPERRLWGWPPQEKLIRIQAGDTTRLAVPVPSAGPPQPILVQSPKEPSWTLEYACMSLALGSALVSIHYKFRADRLDDAYRRTGDPDLYRRVARLDRVAGAALLVTELTLAVLFVRLARRW
ncbi:MAG: hypothetical protein N2561_00465 [Bacteroidetes bacterium]|nr:hypothetical protein [Bacteroidota bacterium]MCX7906000.1 hypothetical protein [Bacteroidota bacterium]MDW8138128.1 hypothetical protein [Bacteroidota bacterium]